MSVYTRIASHFLLEKLGNRPASKAHQQAIQMGLQHLGGGYYGKNPDTGATHKIEKDRIVPLSPEEKSSTNSNDGNRDELTPQTPTTNKKTRNVIQNPTAGLNVSDSFDKHEFAKGIERLKAQSMIRLNRSSLGNDPSIVSNFNRFFHRLTVINNLPSGMKKRNELEILINNYGIVQGPNKLYVMKLGKTGGLYKAFGDTFSREALYFLNMAKSEGVRVPTNTTNDGMIKSYLSTTSKPDLGKISYASTDKTVENIFNSSKALSGLPPRFKSLFGPTDANGQMLLSGKKNAKAFFQHSFENNKSIIHTIDTLKHISKKKREVDQTTGFAGMARALTQYQSNMKLILDNFDSIPASQRKSMVEQVYAKMVHDLHVSNADYASSIIKNISEIALYDSEIAGEQEVYLPADGSFPAGDKILVTRRDVKVEKIEAVSVKYGVQENKYYGFPSRATQFCLYHPDPIYRDVLERRVGIRGYELGIRGDIIHEESIWDSFINGTEFEQTFTKEQSHRIRQIGVLMTQMFKSYTKKFQQDATYKDLPVEAYRSIEKQEDYKQIQRRLLAALKSVDQNKLQRALGNTNYKSIMNEKNVMAFFSIVAFNKALKTSNGFDVILHNHQDYKNNQLTSSVVEGTPNIADWQVMWRPFGIGGRGNGSLLIGFNPHANETQQ